MAVCACVAGLALMFSSSAAHADAMSDCIKAAQDALLNGTVDLNGYLAQLAVCGQTTSTNSSTTSSINNGNGNVNSGVASRVVPVSSTTTTGSLPTTGSNSGRFVGVGAALIVLGGAALYGATRNRRETSATESGPSEE